MIRLIKDNKRGTGRAASSYQPACSLMAMDRAHRSALLGCVMLHCEEITVEPRKQRNLATHWIDGDQKTAFGPKCNPTLKRHQQETPVPVCHSAMMGTVEGFDTLRRHDSSDSMDRVIFNVVNFSKTKSLYRDGMSPVVKSTSRPKCLRVFVRYTEVVIAPLRQQGIRLATYVDNWLLLAQTQQEGGAHTRTLIPHLSDLGFVVNAEKSISGTELRLGCLHMRDFQYWVASLRLDPVRHGVRRVLVTSECVRALRHWRASSFLTWGMPMESGHYRCKSVRLGRNTQGSVCERTLERWSPTVSHKFSGALGGVSLPETLPPVSRRSPCLGEDGQYDDSGIYQSSRGVAFPSVTHAGTQTDPLEQRASPLPESDACSGGTLNTGADLLSRGVPVYGEWTLHPEIVEQIWTRYS
eukprot:superscaffoldBa00000879_g7786